MIPFGIEHLSFDFLKKIQERNLSFRFVFQRIINETLFYSLRNVSMFIFVLDE